MTVQMLPPKTLVESGLDVNWETTDVISTTRRSLFIDQIGRKALEEEREEEVVGVVAATAKGARSRKLPLPAEFHVTFLNPLDADSDGVNFCKKGQSCKNDGWQVVDGKVFSANPKKVSPGAPPKRDDDKFEVTEGLEFHRMASGHVVGAFSRFDIGSTLVRQLANGTQETIEPTIIEDTVVENLGNNFPEQSSTFKF
ncbi:MAG: hypothetical protein Q9227_001674 [Pyrenula ochraceoflavens]